MPPLFGFRNLTAQVLLRRAVQIGFGAGSLVFAWLFVAGPYPFGFDAMIYIAASAAWLSGQDPWAVSILGFHYAALPPTVLALVPFALLPTLVGAGALVAISCIGSVYAIQRLRFPRWWLLYPPLAVGMLSGNVGTLALALAISPFAALAPIMKVPAALPLIGGRRWRSLVVAVIITLVSIPLWPDFVAAGTSGRILSESGGGWSAWAYPALLIPTGVAVLMIARYDVAKALWLAVPSLWPGTEYHWAIFALPASPIASLAMAIPIPGLPAVVVIAMAVAHGSGALHGRLGSQWRSLIGNAVGTGEVAIARVDHETPEG